MPKQKNLITVRYADGTTRVASPAEFQKKPGRLVQYRRHLRSPRWRELRRRVRERDGDRCKVCRAKDSEVRLEVHHLTYVRFGHERLEDLALLCQRCHAGEHQWRNFRRARGLPDPQ